MKERNNEAGGIKMMRWNVAGVWNKDEELWNYVTSFECICLVETWLEEKIWMAWKRKLNSGFMWWNFAARREKKKGRVSGGILIAIRKEWIGGKECEAKEQEEVVKGKVLIGGDFNIRIGEGENRGFKEGKERKRNSKDKKVSNEGKFMLEVIGRKGWKILNGNAGRDEEGEYTYTGGRGASVIDYVIVNEEAW
uniref:Endonuclease/exonuclease/phosphatase domain-containing protein n=1 Tax=Trichogramma kaykai TaxID=54128 RepID=A0ABD2WY04_9HYME